MIDPIWAFSRFQQTDRQNIQILNNETFCRLPVTNAQFINGTEKYQTSTFLLDAELS